MAAKFFFVLCASLALVNTITSCPCGSPAWSAWPAAALGGCAYNAVAVDNGGALGVTSVSALAPSGISILSENIIEGCVDVAGALPLLAAVGFEGNLPTAGSAGTSYCCGSGNVAITPESLAAAGLAAGASAYGPGRIGLGVNYGAANLGAAIAGAEIAGINAGLPPGIWNGPGCGCGNIYY